MAGIETALAHDIVLDAAEKGSTGAEVADHIERAREGVENLQEQTTQNVYDVTAGNVSMPQTDVFQPIIVGAQTGEVDLDALGQKLDKTADVVDDIAGDKKTEMIAGPVSGYAYQGTDGSSVLDVTSAMTDGGETGSVIDTSELSDLEAHEREHEEQAVDWNSEVESIGNGETISRHDVSETGSMSVQKTIKNVSGNYKNIFSKVTSLTSALNARETARTGDLKGLAQDIRKSRGVEMEPDQDYAISD